MAKDKAPKSDFYVFSTLSNDNIYRNHAAGGADLPVAIGEGILIKGGANIGDGRIATPRGVMTPVTSDELEYLNANDGFKMHKQNGFLTVSDKLADADDVAEDMEPKDTSAPVVAGDLAPSEPVPKAVAPAAETGGNSRKA